MSLVLVVEDDHAILRGLEESLRFERYDVLSAEDGESGYRLALEKKPDLIILDLMLPKINGFEVCRKLRSERFVAPILMLTARGEETDRVLGLDLGADDYVTKPFSVRELLARVRALLRRTQASDALPNELRFDDVAVDFLRYEALKGGRSVEMTRKEFGLLRVLAAKAGQVVTREALLNEVWGYDNYPTTRTVDNHIALLRTKLENNPADPRHLLTFRGVGYKLVIGP
ncbi:MAG: response regulator transcription factor [Acidobacteria bacterium]|nr:response regulator transcription factor [Acidobacteriota bacterium]